MTIRNQADLEALIASRFADNTAGDIAESDIRAQFQDHIDSLQAYAAVASGGPVTGFTVAETPTLYPDLLDANSTPSATPVLEADFANNQLKVFENGRYELTLRMQSSWTANKDITFLVYVNGIPNIFTPIAFTQEGIGDSTALSFTAVTFLINSSMLIVQGDGTYAKIQLFLDADPTTTFTQTSMTFGLSYGPLSIDTIPG
jgi:hypothetical protein